MDSVYGASAQHVSVPGARLSDYDSRERFGDWEGPRGRAVARFDQTLVYTTLALVMVGLMSVFTASAAQADFETGNSVTTLLKQLISVLIGSGFLLFFMGFSFERLNRFAIPFSLLCVGLLMMTMLMGTTANGSERWIMLPLGFQFQPSDFAKVGAIILMAQATSQGSLSRIRPWLNVGLVAVMTFMILQQPNLSVTMILGMLTFVMLFVAGLSRLIVVGSLPVLAFVVYQKIRHTEYQWKRIVGWLNPWKDAQDAGYNLIQSYYAIGSGGLFGVGLGNSIQKLYYLPFQHTDFIFSVICEEWGFIGALIVIGLFVLLGWRGFTIAWHCPSRFGKMLAFGLTLAIVLQALINISVTIGLMPVTGVTLPLISYGGTSMIVTLSMIGILLNISKARPARVPQEDY